MAELKNVTGSAGLAVECITLLLEADVIPCTIGVMRNLERSLAVITRIDPGSELAGLLLRLYSESIREALHKGELPITNAIIAHKNRILAASGVERPEGHEEIKASDYPNYHW